MNIFNFLSKKKLDRIYLAVYANLGKTIYADSEKEELVKNFVEISKKLYGTVSLKFDIGGSGYGISKGSPCFGQKAFDNKLKKFGYRKLDGIRVQTEIQNISSQFILISSSHLELCFFWKNDSEPALKKALDLIIEVSKFTDVEYAYAYPSTRELFNFEWILRKGFFSSGYTTPETQSIFRKNIEKTKDGYIKKIYPVNYFNPTQLAKLTNLIPEERFMLDNENEIWIFNSNLDELNLKAINCILK